MLFLQRQSKAIDYAEKETKSLAKILSQQKHSACHLTRHTSSHQPLEARPTKVWSLQPSLHTELSTSGFGREMPLLGPGLCPCQAEPTHTEAEPLGKASTRAAQCLSLVLHRTGGWQHSRATNRRELKPWRRLPTAKASQSCEELFSFTAC